MTVLYAIAHALDSEDLGAGAFGESLAVVRVDGLVLVVGRRDAVEPPSQDILRAYDAVIRQIAEHTDALLPARYGTAGLESEIVTAIRARVSDFEGTLARVAGCEQMTLRIFAEQALPPAPDPRPPGTRYLVAARRVLLGAPEAVDELRRTLAPWIRDERIEPHQSPPLRASVYHLVPRGSSGAYRDAVDDARERIAPVTVTVTGPWPPYAFATESIG